MHAHTRVAENPKKSVQLLLNDTPVSSPSGVRGRAPEALALFMFLNGKIQHLINIPAPNLLKLTSRKRDILERNYVKRG